MIKFLWERESSSLGDKGKHSTEWNLSNLCEFLFCFFKVTKDTQATNLYSVKWQQDSLQNFVI